MIRKPRELKHRRPGDRLIRVPRMAQQRLRRVLTVPAIYAAGYGNVGSSIYYALGIVAVVAMGATPIAFLAAGILFVSAALTYSEGSAMFPEAGGSSSFARHGFNETMGFVSGWALMLSYVATIAISAFTIPPYLGYLWEPLKTDPALGTLVSILIVLFLMVVNIVGIKETSFLNMGAAALDVAVQVLIIVLGFTLIFNFRSLAENMFGAGNWPTTTNLLFGVALSALAYTGVETMAQMAEETRLPHIRVPKAMMMMVGTVIIVFSGVSIVGFSALSPGTIATEWARDPVAGIANSFPSEWLRGLFRPLVSLLAATILLIATNAGLIGISRLAFSMSGHRVLPPVFGRLHARFRTPSVSIILFTTVAILILLPGLFGTDIVGVFRNLGALYTFGSLLSIGLAHASILSLRIRQPGHVRPFKIWLNVKILGREIPLTALGGLAATLSIWTIIVIVQPYSRWLGLGWMALGLVVYLLLWRRRSSGK